MNKSNPHILELISNYFDKSITDDQYNELKLWLEETPGNKEFFIEYISFYKKTRRIALVETIDEDRAWNNLLAKIKEPIQLSKKSTSKVRYLRSMKHILKYAAVLLCVVGVSYFYLNKDNVPAIQDGQLIIADEAITLELENGKVKVIDPTGKEKIIDKTGKVVRTQNGTELVYSKDTKKEKLEYNTLTIPYGKQFKLQLSDGTIVHLNAGTSFKYPVNFIKGKNRKVFLNGEAYFDVAKDVVHPFIVNANEVNVRVLGTQFNISSYPDDQEINTVLIEGSVRLYGENELYSLESSTEINPGDLAEWNKSQKTMEVSQVDTSIYTGWRNNILVFRNLEFHKIIKILERNYNLTIVNNNKKLNSEPFTARFDNATIEHVMKSFKDNYDIKLKIENNQIIIN